MTDTPPDTPAPEIRFYHLQNTALTDAVVQLLAVCTGRGWNAGVVSDSAEFLQAVDGGLWGNGADFVPHAVAGDMHNGRYDVMQSVLLSPTPNAINTPQVVFVVGGGDYSRADFGGVPLICHVFDGRDGDSVTHARGLWKKYDGAGECLTYWQQENGKWNKK